MYEIVIGRSESDLKRLGLKGTIFLGKHYVKMGPTTSLSNKIMMDVARAHVVLISGKRGSGKCIKPNSKVLLSNKKLKPIDKLFLQIKKTGKMIINKKNEELVKSNKNLKAISLDLKFHFNKLKLVNKLITHAYRKKINENIYKIQTLTGKIIEATKEHPLLAYKNKKLKWVKAKYLKKNDRIISFFNKTVTFDIIKSIKKQKYSSYVYDLTIKDTHNFIANDIICHNSYTLGVIAEEIIALPEEVRNRLSILIFDTMGIYWTMKFKNEKDEDLLTQWDLPKKALDIDIYVPKGQFKEFKEKDIPADFSFAIKPSEVSAGDWCEAFDIKLTESIGVFIERLIAKSKEKYGDHYSIEDLVAEINLDKETNMEIKNAAKNRFIAAESWGVFDVDATPLKQIVDSGKVSVLDLSAYTYVSGNWNIKNLVIGIVCRKLMQERMISRKSEEIEDVKTGHSYFIYEREKGKEELPLVWIFLDEAHEALAKDYKTPATDALVQILREGRQPGISLVMATQQPGEIHRDVITQTDIVISHRLTAKRDVEALNSMMQSYLTGTIQKYIDMLPRESGSAVILDDNSEKIYPMRVRPRFTWHGGEAPTAVKVPGKAVEELGL